MATTQTSLHLLQHFDSAAVTVLPAGELLHREPSRGIAWVLKWTAALAVLVYAVTVLTEFAYCVMAEQRLSRAAQAGVLEATLPRATRRTVEQSVWRRLDGHVESHDDVNLALLQNGALVGKNFRSSDGDQFTIHLDVPAQAAMPNWLRRLTSWRKSAPIVARAERIIPRRQLAQRSKE